jgi:hypothetical protein
VTAKSLQVRVPYASGGSSENNTVYAACPAGTARGGYRREESDGAVIVTVPAVDEAPDPTARISLETRIPVVYPAAEIVALLRHVVISVSITIGKLFKRFDMRIPL